MTLKEFRVLAGERGTALSWWLQPLRTAAAQYRKRRQRKADNRILMNLDPRMLEDFVFDIEITPKGLSMTDMHPAAVARQFIDRQKHGSGSEQHSGDHPRR